MSASVKGAERETDPLQDFRVDDHAYFAQKRFAIADRWSVPPRRAP